MCISKYVGGVYEKSCAKPDMCEECDGVEDCYCCQGNLCNKGEEDGKQTDKHVVACR